MPSRRPRPVAGRLAVVGHPSAAMTLDICAGLFDDDLGAFAERMMSPSMRTKASRSVGTVWARDSVVKIDDHETSH